MEKDILFFEDAGHGWAKVSINELKTLGISNKISQCSYINGEYAYLEEDCDLVIYIDKLKELHSDISFHFRTHYTDTSKIRGYKHYNI